jgi:hypothetical protein
VHPADLPETVTMSAAIFSPDRTTNRSATASWSTGTALGTVAHHRDVPCAQRQQRADRRATAAWRGPGGSGRAGPARSLRRRSRDQPTAASMYGWTVSWVLANDETITGSWNGTLPTAGSLATMNNAARNNTLPPGGTAMFGFTANETSSLVLLADIS